MEVTPAGKSRHRREAWSFFFHRIRSALARAIHLTYCPRGLSPVASYVVQSLVTLLGVAALAVLLLYGARKTGMGRASGPIELVGRLPLDGRRTVYLVRVESTVFVLGSSEAGLVKLGEVPAAGKAPAPESELGS